MLRHVVDARQFTRQWLEEVLFPKAVDWQGTPLAGMERPLAGRRLFYLFYEASTRTRVSFEMAATLLGASVHGIDAQQETAREERLEDRVRVLNEYAIDYLLLRYFEEGGAARAAAVSRASVVNAGDGAGQHPTQALLDVYTLWRELGRVDGLRIALVGDLSHERTTNSLAYVLAQYSGIKLYLVAPRLLSMRSEVREHLVQAGVAIEDARDLRSVADQVDVVYVTRAHSSRLEHAQRFDADGGMYAVDGEVMARLPVGARVLHPLPRGPELPWELDEDPRIACFRQAANGLYVRMALLSLLATA
ncbi:MAG TPA: aspartate carbamoyltransferase [Chloroflexota bacterium]|nr:aspartate carbamoyltransferase [Chloroflexota bacterium]